MQLRNAPVADVDPVILYRLLWLRVSVFVVEQAAAYPELDGRDIEPGAEMVWAQDGDDVLATLRLLHDGDAMRVGRVVAAAGARGRGVADELMRHAVARCEELAPHLPVVLDAQRPLVDWYGRFGFVVDGPGHVEDGIPHVPMRRPVLARHGTGDPGPFFHGTKADLAVGDLLEPGRSSNFGGRGTARFVYLTATLDAATWGAELAVGDLRGRVYRVEPTGPIEDDPNLTDQRFPGNPTRSYRTRAPLRVVGEVADWSGHAPEVLQAMRDHLAHLERLGVEAIND